MRSITLKPPDINTSITLLVLLALLVLPLGLGMGQSAPTNLMHRHHAQHAPEHTAPSPSCEHFHICCACLVIARSESLVLSIIALITVHIQFQSIPQAIPTPPPRG